MIPLTVPQFVERLREIIFELSSIGLNPQADQLNRAVFECAWSSDHAMLTEISSILRQYKGVAMQSGLRERIGMLEGFAKNHKRLFQEG